MRKLAILFVITCVFLNGIFAKDVSEDDGAKLKITTRTSFGLNLDETYRYGLKNEFTAFDLVINLLPYQQLTNKVKNSDPVGFINVTLFDLDILFPNVNLGWHDKDNVRRSYLQTGSFQAGIAFDNFIFQLAAGGNEPFWSPWNKSFEYLNDNVKFSWAYLDSVVDVKRVQTIDEISNVDSSAGGSGQVVSQFKQDDPGLTDSLGFQAAKEPASVPSNTIALLYNDPDGQFGLNLKFATQYAFDSADITANDANGLAFGVDTIIAPKAMAGFRTFISAGGKYNYNNKPDAAPAAGGAGHDSDPDPVAAGFKVAYDIALDEATSIEPYIGLDTVYLIPDAVAGGGDQFDYEAGAGFTMHWPGKGGWYTDYILDMDGRVFPGLSLAYKLLGSTKPGSTLRHDLKFTLFEERGDEGLFYGLGSEMVVDFYNILDPYRNDLLATVYLDYTIPGFGEGQGSLVPWTTLLYDNLANATDLNAPRDSNFKINLGVKLVEAISNTTFNLAWYSGNLITEDKPIVGGLVKVTVDIKF